MTEEEKLFAIEKLEIKRSEIPAVTHADYSIRIQTLHESTNPRHHALIRKFQKLTGRPVVVNTLLSVRVKPVVCTPTDAFKCFMGAEMDVFVVGNIFLEREQK